MDWTAGSNGTTTTQTTVTEANVVHVHSLAQLESAAASNSDIEPTEVGRIAAIASVELLLGPGATATNITGGTVYVYTGGSAANITGGTVFDYNNETEAWDEREL